MAFYLLSSLVEYGVMAVHRRHPAGPDPPPKAGPSRPGLIKTFITKLKNVLLVFSIIIIGSYSIFVFVSCVCVMLNTGKVVLCTCDKLLL